MKSRWQATASRTASTWNGFWFGGEPVAAVARIRGAFCLWAAIYFLSLWSDLEFWFGPEGVQAPDRVTSFLTAAGLERDARWYLSPLFLTTSTLLLQLYLLIGVALAVVVAAGRGGRIAAWGLWLVFLGAANRTIFLAGLAETLISFGLFASAVARPAPLWQTVSINTEAASWTASLARRMMAVHATLFGVATIASMLAGSAWWNGTGAYALAAPAKDRTLDLSRSWLSIPIAHDLLTHALIIGLPVALVLGWRGKQAAGRVVIVTWCLVVAVLGSHWLYAASLATMSWAIGPPPHAPRAVE